jgi:hypothetical protein
MSERFDDLSRAMAEPQSRRGVLKVFGGAALAAAAATMLKPFRGDAVVQCSPGLAACGDGCCPAGQACLNASNGTCGCPSGTTACGANCCSGTSSDASTCCCPSGTTPCGIRCCASGVACIDKANGVCGCPSGHTSCGSVANRTCCPAGVACGSAKCQPVGTFTGTNRVAKSCCGCNGTCCPGRNDQCRRPKCGGGSCYCDEYCQTAGDCCSDFNDTCGGGAFVAPAGATPRS